MTLFHTLSKLAWYAVEPSHLLLWTLIAAAIQSARRKAAGAILAGICAATLLLLLLLPIGNWALRPLEDRYPRPDPPARIDGILVLGEGLNGEVMATRGAPGIGTEGGALIAARILAGRYPDARLVYTGDPGEAAVAGPLFRDMGMSGPQVIDGQSWDTWENFLRGYQLAQPKPGETWLLVANAYHLPRALAVADKMDWKMLPWPADYLTAARGQETHLSMAANLGHLDVALHETLGLWAYRLAGKAR